MRADARMPAQGVRERGFPDGNSSVCQDPGTGVQPPPLPLPSPSGPAILGLTARLIGGDTPYLSPSLLGKEAEGPRGG